MSRHSSGRGVGQQSPFLPRVEELETREVPTVNFLVMDSTLLIQSARGNSPTTLSGNRILIQDNGTNGINNVIAQASGRTFVSNVAITDVIVIGSRQADRVQYNLVGDLVGRRSLYVDLKAGDDRFDAFLRRNLRSNANLQIAVRGGQGNDRITSTTVAQLAAGAVLDVYLEGGAGDDTVRALTTSFVGISPNAQYNVSLSGGAGNDILQATYQGRMDGTMSLFMDCGSGNDKASATYTLMRGSTGSMQPAALLGGSGNDDLTMLIGNFGTGLTLNNLLDGGGGFDVATRTTNVITVAVSEDNIV